MVKNQEPFLPTRSLKSEDTLTVLYLSLLNLMVQSFLSSFLCLHICFHVDGVVCSPAEESLNETGWDQKEEGVTAL